MNRPKHGKPQLGLTITEIVLVIAVISVLAAVAIPNYQRYMQQTKRVEVQAHLMEISHKLASYHLVNQSFADVTLEDLSFHANFPQYGQANYSIGLTDLQGKALTVKQSQQQTWLLVATPLEHSGQAGSGKLSLTHRGDQCWYMNQDDAVAFYSRGSTVENLAPICPAAWQ